MDLYAEHGLKDFGRIEKYNALGDNPKAGINNGRTSLEADAINRIKELKNWMIYIADIADIRDEYHNIDLCCLIDDLKQMALDGLHGEECPINYYGAFRDTE